MHMPLLEDRGCDAYVSMLEDRVRMSLCLKKTEGVVCMSMLEDRGCGAYVSMLEDRVWCVPLCLKTEGVVCMSLCLKTECVCLYA